MTGFGNVGIGAGALVSSTSDENTAIGKNAGFSLVGGTGNILIGSGAGLALTGSESNNIDIGSPGAAGDGTTANTGVIRIGTFGNQTSFFAQGIHGVTVPSGVDVIISPTTGQLGTVVSSRRFKEDIHDMNDASQKLMQLRPVSFRYKQAAEDGSKPLQYGLIAEEVAEVYPELAVYSQNGEIQSVRYNLLISMLLNELQHQQAQIKSLQQQIAKL